MDLSDDSGREFRFERTSNVKELERGWLKSSHTPTPFMDVCIDITSEERMQ